MPYKFNPFTGTLDYFEITNKEEVINSILLDKKVTGELEILFDEDSILTKGDNT